jgi:hypothetical protein
MKTKIKKLSKTVVIKGKGKVKKQVKKLSTKAYDKVEMVLRAAIAKSDKKDYFHFKKNCAAYRSVAYFLANRPVENRIYKAAVVLKGYDRSIPSIRRNVQLMLLLVFPQFKKIEGLKWVGAFKNKFTEFKFIKKA